MALQGHRQLIGGNAHAVVFHADEAHTTGEQSQGDLCGSRVERVVYQFAHNRSRAFDHLASGDLADQFIWEFADGAWGLGSRVHGLILEAGG